MTVSHFTALEARTPMVDAERAMTMAQAALYPHLTREGGQKLWAGWERQARPAVEARPGQAGALFTLNGRPVAADALEQQITALMGLGAVA